MIASRISSVAATLAFRTSPPSVWRILPTGANHTVCNLAATPTSQTGVGRVRPWIIVAPVDRAGIARAGRRRQALEALEFERDAGRRAAGPARDDRHRARGARVDAAAFAGMAPADVAVVRSTLDPESRRARRARRRAGRADGRRAGERRAGVAGGAGGRDRPARGGDRLQQTAPAGVRALPRGAGRLTGRPTSHAGRDPSARSRSATSARCAAGKPSKAWIHCARL